MFNPLVLEQETSFVFPGRSLTLANNVVSGDTQPGQLKLKHELQAMLESFSGFSPESLTARRQYLISQCQTYAANFSYTVGRFQVMV